MKRLMTLTMFFLMNLSFSYAGAAPETLVSLSEDAQSAIPAVLVENVLTARASRGEYITTASLITVYSGSVMAPYKTYLKVFDPIPQKSGDYGSFKVFAIEHLQDGFPKNLKVEFAREGDAVFVGYDVRYFDQFNERGEAIYKRGRFITKLKVVSPIAEGALSETAEFTIRR